MAPPRGPKKVLNAFRHHGERDIAEPILFLDIDGVLKCSTPSGITASATTRQGHVGQVAIVLNAFRHHGERDLTYEHDCFKAGMCSTPSGITASATPSGGTTVCLLRGVLNAFRHHGERDG